MRRVFQAVVSGWLVALFAVTVFGQPLPTDPALVTGQLENGLRYIVQRHAEPPQRTVMWLHLDTGSLNETDVQRGLAHYLEHMAFNGSENFPPGQVVPFFQSLGMTFGRDQNAFTSFDQTTYQLTLPSVDPQTITSGMKYLADVLFRLSLLPKEIDSERQIIQEERRQSLSGQQRTSFYVLERMVPGSIFGERIPIGTEQTIDSVRQRDFLDYYRKWYVASNATMLVVADTDPQEIVKLIQDNFGSAPRRPRPEPQDVGVKPYAQSFAIVASDPEVRSEQIRITRVEPARPPITTVPLLKQELVADIATAAFNRRLEDKIAAGGTSYLRGNVSVGNELGVLYTAELSGSAKPGKWAEALQELAVELQRGRLYGFSDREVDDVKKTLLSRAERAGETEATRPAGSIISSMNRSVADGEPILSAGQRLERLEQLLPEVTTEEVGQRFAAEFDTQAVCFTAILPSSASVPTEAELLALGTKALDVKPERESAVAHATELMSALPEPGTLTELTKHEPTGVWSGWLSNNVRVHYRFMDEQENDVTIRITLYGGQLFETAQNRGITQMATIGWMQPATEHLSSADIRSLMTGKRVRVGGAGSGGGRGRGRRGGGGGGSGDAISLSVSGSPDDLEFGMQLAYLLLTEPKIEGATFHQMTTQLRLVLQQMQTNASGVGMQLASGAPYPADVARTQPLTIQQLDQLDLPAVQAWLQRLIQTSPIEVAIVGDLPEQRAQELVTRYLGSLPPRQRVAPSLFSELRQLKRPDGAVSIVKMIPTETPQAFVYSGFFAADESNIPDTRALSMATMILSTRMIREIREEEQYVYSIRAQFRAGTTYPGFGMVYAAAPTDPGKADKLLEKIGAMYAQLAREGVSQEELDVAHKQIANTLDTQLREPDYWLDRLANLTFRDGRLDDVVEAPAAYQAITADQIRDTVARYYAPDKSVSVVAKPEPKSAKSGE